MWHVRTMRSSAIGMVRNYSVAAPNRRGLVTSSVSNTIQRSREFYGDPPGVPYNGDRYDAFEDAPPDYPKKNQPNARNHLACFAAVLGDENCVNLIGEGIDEYFNKYFTLAAHYPTTGRATYCPFEDKSVPAPQAYSNLLQVLDRNTGKRVRVTLLELLEDILVILNKKEGIEVPKDSIRTQKVPRDSMAHDDDFDDDPTLYDTMGDDPDDVANAHLAEPLPDGRLRRYVKVRRWIVMSQEELWKRTLIADAYQKHGERAKYKARSIYSFGMIVRVFKTLIEESCAQILSKTISPDRKQRLSKLAEINSILSRILGSNVQWEGVITSSLDHEKWNELMKIIGVIMLLLAAYRKWVGIQLQRALPDRRKQLAIRRETYDIVARLMVWVMSNKRIKAGPGYFMKFKGRLFIVTLPDLIQYPDLIQKFDEETQLKIKELLTDYDPGTNTVEMVHGMGMGVMNACSSIMPAMMNVLMHNGGFRYQFSDDAVNVTAKSTYEEASLMEFRQRAYLAGCGISVSYAKTCNFQRYVMFELNSLFDFGACTPQLVTALVAAIVPAMKNPDYDLNTILKTLRTIKTDGSITLAGMTVAMEISLRTLRSVYRSRMEETSGDVDILNGIPRRGQCLTLEWRDSGLPFNAIPSFLGGQFICSPSMLQNELAVRHVEKRTPNSMLLRICNPENPMSGGSQTVSSGLIKMGRMVYHLDSDVNSTAAQYKISGNLKWKNDPEAYAKMRAAAHDSTFIRIISQLDPELSLSSGGSRSVVDQAVHTLNRSYETARITGDVESQEKITQILETLRERMVRLIENTN